MNFSNEIKENNIKGFTMALNSTINDFSKEYSDK